MVCLNEKQVDEIRQQIEAKGAEMEELTNDLLDHICCMIEERMNNESEFQKVFQETMAVFGKNGIQNIQDETTFLLTKNILAMKKTSHIIGIAAAIFLLIATFLKIYHLPGAGILYVLGGFFLSFIFLPLMLTIKIKEKISKSRVWLNVAGTVSGFVLVNAVFFKVMHWPGANVLMNIGGFLSLFIFLPLYVYAYIKNKEKRTTTITTAVMIVGAMSMLFALVKLHDSKVVTDSLTNIHYNMNNNVAKTVAYNYTMYDELKNDTVVDVNFLNDIKSKVLLIRELIDKMKIQFALGGNEKLSAKEVEKALKDNYELIMKGKGDLNAIRTNELTINQLLKEVEHFELLTQQVLGSKYKITINQSNFKIYNNPQFNNFPLEIVINDLTFLEMQILLEEKNVLIAIKK